MWRQRNRDRDSRSVSPEALPKGVSEISENDFFRKNDEFVLWLKQEKDKYFSDLSNEKARSYFRKFVKNWNKGRLARKYYDGVDNTEKTASSSTAYKWAFTTSDRVSEKDIKGARDAVKEATNAAMPASGRPVQGPTLPDTMGGSSKSAVDRQYEREILDERQQRERQSSRKRARQEEADKVEDMIGPKAVGREGMQEKKRARRENDREFREKDAEPDIDADDLMGGDSFQARKAQRDAARKRFEDKRQADREAKETAVRDRRAAIKEKDKATMDMFKALAKERYGNAEADIL